MYDDDDKDQMMSAGMDDEMENDDLSDDDVAPKQKPVDEDDFDDEDLGDDDEEGPKRQDGDLPSGFHAVDEEE
ncbi:hypothetical protein JXA59_01610 [Patescibacteria group bacterium]|nr:hypothetical protein [Patescibacteria group bacterium]